MRVQLTIFRKGLLLIAVPLAFQLAILGFVAALHSRAVRSSAWHIHTKEVLRQADSVARTLAEGTAAIRGFALAQRPEFRTAYEASMRQIEAAISDLHQRVADNPQQQAQVQAIRKSLYSLQKWRDDNIRLIEEGRQEVVVERTRSLQGQSLVNQLQAELGQFAEEENRLEVLRAALLNRERAGIYTTLVAGTLVSVLAAVFACHLFHRGVARRLATLTTTLNDIAEGRRLSPPLDGGDEIRLVDWAVRDLARRIEQSNAALQEQTHVLECVVESMGDGLVVADEQGKFVIFNSAAEQILGRGATAATPDEWTERYGVFLPDQKTPCPTEALPLVRALQGEEVNGSELFIRHEGRPEGAWLNVNGRPLKDADGTRRGGVTVFRDVTEFKRSNLERAQLAAIVECCEDAIIGQSLDSNIFIWNRAASRLFGYEPHEVLGRPAQLLASPDYQANKDALFQCVCRGETIEPFESVGLRKDGSTVSLSVSLSPIRQSSTILGVAKVLRDITRQKQAEQALQQAAGEIQELNVGLEARVRERTAELAEANASLQQKNQENELFVYSVSHDLRSPLVNLQGFCNELQLASGELGKLVARRDVPADVQASAAELLERDMGEAIQFIGIGVGRLSNIIDALLRLSRLGRVEYVHQVVNADALVHDVVASLQATIAEAGAQMRIESLAPTWGDPSALEHVFSNLIGNAIKYRDAARPLEVEVGCLWNEAPAAEVTYYVKDNGLGLAPEHWERVFQAFQRVHPEVAPGDGIGLATVRRIVERHGGRAWLESTVGQGSTFFVALPSANMRTSAAWAPPLVESLA